MLGDKHHSSGDGDRAADEFSENFHGVLLVGE
jgi:hypothetical protein